MLKSNILFESNKIKSKNYLKNYNKNILRASKVLKKLKHDIEHENQPELSSLKKNYKFSFFFQKLAKFRKFKNIVIIGMGGSILGTKSIYSFLKNKIKKNVFFIDNLDKNLLLNYKKNFSKKTCFLIISKSGNTPETIINLKLLLKKYSIKNNSIVITENKKSFLFDILKILDSTFIEHNKFIGGRYSVLSEVGIVPSILMNLQIKKFINFDILKNKKDRNLLVKNVARILTLHNMGYKNSVLLIYNSELLDLGYWYQQLVGESLGKKGKGILPVVSAVPKDNHSLLQLYLEGTNDKFFTFFSCDFKTKTVFDKKLGNTKFNFLNNKSPKDLVNAQRKATKQALNEKNIPFRSFSFIKNSESEIGSIFAFLILETVILGKLLNVNPYDQPGVEIVKSKTKKILLNN